MNRAIFKRQNSHTLIWMRDKAQYASFIDCIYIPSTPLSHILKNKPSIQPFWGLTSWPQPGHKAWAMLPFNSTIKSPWLSVTLGLHCPILPYQILFLLFYLMHNNNYTCIIPEWETINPSRTKTKFYISQILPRVTYDTSGRFSIIPQMAFRWVDVFITYGINLKVKLQQSWSSYTGLCSLLSCRPFSLT